MRCGWVARTGVSMVRGTKFDRDGADEDDRHEERPTLMVRSDDIPAWRQRLVQGAAHGFNAQLDQVLFPGNTLLSEIDDVVR